MRFFRSTLPVSLVLFSLPATGQQALPPDRALRAGIETVYELRLPAEGTPQLPARANSLAFDRGGRLFILDRASTFVWVFGAGGTLERKINLGEAARSALQMTVAVDGSLVMTDPARRRFVVVDPDRPHSASMHAFGDVIVTGPLIAHPNGGVVTQVRPLPDPSGGEWARDQMPLMWFRLDGRPAVQLHTFRRTPEVRGGAPGFSTIPLFAPLPSGAIAIADPREYRISLIRDGHAQHIVRSVRRRAVGERDRRSAAARAACAPLQMVGPGGRAPADPAMVARAAAQQGTTDQLTALSRLAWSPAGQIWIERTGTDLNQPGLVDVYTDAGSYVGSVANIGVPDAWARDARTAAFVRQDSECRTTITVKRIRLADAQ